MKTSVASAAAVAALLGMLEFVVVRAVNVKTVS